MEILVWLLPGALIGWTAGVLLRRESAVAMLANIAIGVVGAACGLWLLAPALDVAVRPEAPFATGLPMAVLGAILLLALANLLAPLRGRRRNRAEATPSAAHSEQPV